MPGMDNFILICLLIACIAWLVARATGPSEPANQSQASPDPDTEPKADAPPIGKGRTIQSPLPASYQIYVSRPTVAGLQHHGQEALRFIGGSNHSLRLELEPDNNAAPIEIKLIGVITSGECLLGYLPAELAKRIIGSGLFDVVQARLTRLHVGNDGSVGIQYQLIGPKERKPQFDDFQEFAV